MTVRRGVPAPRQTVVSTALESILRLHRHKRGYIVLSTEVEDEFRYVISIRRDSLTRQFSGHFEDHLKDFYVTINAGFRLGRAGPDGAAYGYPKHDSASLAYLCACYADLDFYKLEMDASRALAAVRKYEDSGVIPPVSIVVHSGRGLWLLWLLHDPKNTSNAQRAWPEKVRLYTDIQLAISERLATIGADSTARDAARHIRVPGSLNTASEQYVRWSHQDTEAGAISYTLQDLVRLFELTKRAKSSTKRVNEGEAPKNRNKRRGWEALNSSRLRDFQRLLELRGGGVDEGCRNRAALLYAFLLRWNRRSRKQACFELADMARACRPPLTINECQRAINAGFGKKFWKIKDQTISDWLNVTPIEAERLERFGAASGFGIARSSEQPGRGTGRAVQVHNRRTAITQIINERRGLLPSCRELAGLLQAAGYSVSHVTVAKDLAALGLRQSPSRKSSD